MTILKKITQVNERFNEIQALTFQGDKREEIRRIAKDSLGDLFELMTLVNAINPDENQ